MRSYRINSHSKTNLQVHLVWIPKYRKRVLSGEVAIRVRDILRQVASEHDIHIISGKIAIDHVHMFVSFRPDQPISKIVQYLKGISSRLLLQEFSSLRRQFWGSHFWARGYLAVTAGNITDLMVQKYIEEQEGESVHSIDRFSIEH
jgi:putative transposase